MGGIWDKSYQMFSIWVLNILSTVEYFSTDEVCPSEWRFSAVYNWHGEWCTDNSYTKIPSSLKGFWNSWSQESPRPDSCLGSYTMISKVRDQHEQHVVCRSRGETWAWLDPQITGFLSPLVWLERCCSFLWIKPVEKFLSLHVWCLFFLFCSFFSMHLWLPPGCVGLMCVIKVSI